MHGDHFFGKCKFTLVAERRDAAAHAAVEAADAAVLAKRRELEPRKREWERVQREYEAAAERVQEDIHELEAMLEARQGAYADLLGLPKSFGHDRQAEGGSGGGGLLGGLFGGRR